RDAYNLDKIKAVEIYQEAFTALYYNVREGKLVRLTSSLKTYLFAIGKNILRDHFKREKRFRHGSDEWQVAEQLDHSIMEKYEQSDMKELVDIALKKIGEPCKTVLKLFYFRHFSMDAIAKELNYKTEQIAAKRKHICLKQMRTLVSTIK
ncbi:MAG: sigma-70 family RNA polymerase sigma factor, partial [Saprospiraceae bacterium]|nr:sigma-70 family RNA polymerase sigma factor [Saprospiraceae bacterium]